MKPTGFLVTYFHLYLKQKYKFPNWKLTQLKINQKMV